MTTKKVLDKIAIVVATLFLIAAAVVALGGYAYIAVTQPVAFLASAVLLLIMWSLVRVIRMPE